MELEQLHSRMHDVWQAHDQLVSITGADDGVTGLDLDSRLQALEQDMQQVHVKTQELDRHINKMLTKMIEFANQGGGRHDFYLLYYTIFSSHLLSKEGEVMHACWEAFWKPLYNLGSIQHSEVQSTCPECTLHVQTREHCGRSLAFAYCLLLPAIFVLRLTYL